MIVPLRDFFAAHAMAAELISSGSVEGPAEALAKAAAKNGITVEAQIARNAYDLADAMLMEGGYSTRQGAEIAKTVKANLRKEGLC